MTNVLAVFQTHPIQYHAPIYQAIQDRHGVPVTAVYGSDFSIRGYRDEEFGVTFSWDTDLLSGYNSVFLARVAEGGPGSVGEITTHGLRAALDGIRPSAVLIAGYSPQFHRAAFFHAWRGGYPILFRAETTDVEPPQLLKAVVRRGALKTMYGQCNRLLYIGERSKRHYERLGCAPSKLVFSPYCTDARAFDPGEGARIRLRSSLRASLKLPDDCLVVVFSGKLTPKKRPDLLLEALGGVSGMLDRPVALVYVGDGELRRSLVRAALTTPDVRTHFAGFINQTQLSPYYHAADLLVLPSQHSETWGVVVNDALCHGLPCVVSNAVGCAPDLVRPESTGEVFETGSAESLRAAIVRAAPLAGRLDVRERCRTLAAEYSVQRAAEGIVRAYRDAISSRN